MRRTCLITALAVLASCGSDSSETPASERTSAPSASEAREGSPNARPDLTEEFRLDRKAVRSAADGAGKAMLEEGGDARVGEPGRWRIAYEVGEPGIAVGGAIYLQIPPLWGWDAPQVSNAEAPGYTTIDIESGAAVRYYGEALGPGLMRCVIEGEALALGDRVVFDYGVGSMGAMPDLYAESGSRFWIAVDGDGDGVRQVMEDSPQIRVRPAAAARMVVTMTSRARPGETARLGLALLDRNGNRAADSTAKVHLETGTPSIDLPREVEIGPLDRGAVTLEFEVSPAGRAVRVRATATDEASGALWSATSNPLVVSEIAPHVYWADLHGHSNLSDGTALPEEYLSYARDIAMLDVIALTDHDHYGVRFLADHPAMWENIQERTAAFHENGRFVTVLGYEWTNWRYGHRHVLYFDGEGEVYDSIDEASDHPRELWTLLADLPAMTIAHHSAGAPVATDWSIPPPRALEPVTEIMSVHGSSEALDSPSRVRGFVRGNAVRDALDRGYRLGFVGSGDSHDGHPGLAHLNPTSGWRPAVTRRGEDFSERLGNGGVTAILAERLDRESVLDALRKRHCYATSGPRICLNVTLGDAGMGDVMPEPDGNVALTVTVQGTAHVRSIELIRSGEVTESDAPGTESAVWSSMQEGLREGEYLYVRVVQEDGGLAWSSPIWIGPASR